MKNIMLRFLMAGLIATLSGCATPRLGETGTSDTAHREHWLQQASESGSQGWHHYAPQQAYLTQVGTAVSFDPAAVDSATALAPTLSAGDRIRVWVPSVAWSSGNLADQDRVYSGVYEIDVNGDLKLPFLPAIPARNLTLQQLERAVTESLETRQVFQAGMAHVSISIQEWAPATVFVSGAVFSAGQVTINPRSKDMPAPSFTTLGGAYALERNLSAALRAAGGIRPDADLAQVQVIRGQQRMQYDLRGIVQGFPVADIPLIQGDRIEVPSFGLVQAALITPTPITPPGMRVYISNLTLPALSNASSAVNKHATSLPYGARLHTAIVSGNCAGGTNATNSGRYAVLVTQDPMRQQAVTIERKVEDVLRNPNLPGLNPYLMPDDSIVCYDSEVTNLRDIARSVLDLVLPLPLLR